MSGLPAATAFQDVPESDQVGVYVGVGVLDRVAYACLGREMHDGVEGVVPKQIRDARAVHDVEFLKREPRVPGQPGKPRLLERDVIVIVEIVDAVNGIAAVEQLVRQGRADEAGGAGD